jgi:hypothetical protein
VSGQSLGVVLIVAAAAAYLIWKLGFSGRRPSRRPSRRPDVTVAGLVKKTRDARSGDKQR